VAVRARNAGVLFASCFEAPVFDALKNLSERWIQLEVNAGGDVAFQETSAGPKRQHSEILRKPVPLIAPPENAPWVILPRQFTRELAGGKSNNLNGLRGKLPEWIQFPPSMTLPFGTFERVLNAPVNRELKGAYEALLASAESEPLVFLPRVRELIVKLHATLELKDAVNEAWGSAGLPPLEWDEAWYGITRVWASKWTDRAFFSRRSRHVPHGNLLMAVLVQQVVEADYAFVIHTVNPINGNKNEVFAEVVCGLGETLVGNYPGRSLGFIFNKLDGSIHLHSYPGKSEGLFGSGVIFRSDSNGEDLQGFAGAGLYDSVLAREPEARVLDYSTEPLVWDAAKRNEVLGAIARIGIEVENALGSAQDIEGAVSRGRYFVVQTRPQVGL
jgi:alpha-glucan, water dikinase